MTKGGAGIFKLVLLLKQSVNELRAGFGAYEGNKPSWFVTYALLLGHILWHKSNYGVPVASEQPLIFCPLQNTIHVFPESQRPL